jgi:hypothetical protein
MTLLFRGDYETGNISQFGTIELGKTPDGTTPGEEAIDPDTASPTGRIIPQAVTSPTQSPTSKYAGKYQTTGTQYRCENTLGEYLHSPVTVWDYPGMAQEGDDLWYGWSVYFAPDLPTLLWSVFGQWHQPSIPGPWFGSPPFAFYAGTSMPDPTHWYLANNGTSPVGVGWNIDLGAIPLGQWTDVTVHGVFSNQAANCLIEIWINGIKRGTLQPPVPLIYPTGTTVDVPHEGSYFKFGIYRDLAATATSTVYYDNLKIGSTRTSVQPDGPAAGAGNVTPHQLKLMGGMVR